MSASHLDKLQANDAAYKYDNSKLVPFAVAIDETHIVLVWYSQW